MLCERIWSEKEKKGEPDHIDEDTSIRDILSRGFAPVEIRYWLLGNHYRKPVHATVTNISNTVRGYRRLREFVSRIRQARTAGEENPALPEMIYELEKGFFDALADDLNLPKALAALFKFARHANPFLDGGNFSESQREQMLAAIRAVDAILGFFDLELQPLSAEETAILSRRQEAREARRWEEADALRAELLDRGIKVTDTPTGTRWERSGSQPPR